jgi:hypothetical protein
MLVDDVRKGWPVVLLLVALSAPFLAWHWSPRRAVGTAFGQVVGVHHLQREDGPPSRRLNVRLRSGEYATVWLPRSAIYLARACVEVRALERDWFSGRSYEFSRYVPDEEARRLERCGSPPA